MLRFSCAATLLPPPSRRRQAEKKKKKRRTPAAASDRRRAARCDCAPLPSRQAPLININHPRPPASATCRTNFRDLTPAVVLLLPLLHSCRSQDSASAPTHTRPHIHTHPTQRPGPGRTQLHSFPVQQAVQVAQGTRQNTHARPPVARASARTPNTRDRRARVALPSLFPSLFPFSPSLRPPWSPRRRAPTLHHRPEPKPPRKRLPQPRSRRAPRSRPLSRTTTSSRSRNPVTRRTMAARSRPRCRRLYAITISKTGADTTSTARGVVCPHPHSSPPDPRAPMPQT